MTALPERILEALQEAAPAGLHRVADRRWVSESEGAIRKILEFQAMKGARYTARWGFSVDFVPRLRGKRLAWKRTLATADFDLCIDPVDAEGIVPAWCSFGGDDGVGRVRKIALAARDSAARDFTAIGATRDLLDLFEKRSKMSFRRFSLENYVQTDLAWGLLQVATGNLEAGSDRLSRFCERFEVDPAAAILAAAKLEAHDLAASQREVR